MSEIIYGGRCVPVSGTFDTVVIGGGTAGAAAAIAHGKMALHHK